MGFDVVIRRGQLVLPEAVVAADLGVAEGVIAAIGPEINGSATTEIDASGLHVFPGVVDVHVHFNEPGRTDWEGAATGSAALAAGGGTCFCDMPLNASPPTLDAESFDLKRTALEASSVVDFGLWGGLVPGNHAHLPDLAEWGVIGFKAFMCHSGIDDFHAIDDDGLGRGMEIAARLGLPVAVHAEDEKVTRELTQKAIAAGRTTVRDYLASRPIAAELDAIRRAVALAEQTGCALHIVHVSSGGGTAIVAEAKARGVDVTCETCPHYLVLTEDDVVRIGAAAKCSPPIRNHLEQRALWDALGDGGVDFIASDHSPSPWSWKESPDFFRVWGGIAGCQTMLGLMIDEGHALRGFPLPFFSEWLSSAPAKRFGLLRKGRLEIGADADLALVDLSARFVLTADELRYRHRISPFLGRTLGGQVRRTMVRGRTAFRDGRTSSENRGRFLRPQRRVPA